jgi:peroxiredoxin
MRGRRVASALMALGILGVAAGCAKEPINRVAADRSLVAESAPPSPEPSVPATAPPTPSPVAPKPAATTQPPKAPAVPTSLNFTGKTVDGKVFRGASLAGKPTVLWFWTPWCPLCHGQVPDVQDAARRFAGKVNVIGVGGLDSAEPIRKFVAEQNTGSFPNVCDDKGTVWKHFGVKQQGTYVLIDKTGKVRHTGYLDGNSLNSRLAKLSG